MHRLQNVGKTGKIAVDDVLGYVLPGGLAVLVDGNGSESCGCNLLDQVQADSRSVCDAESLGLRVAQVTPTTEIRERANSVCAEDARRCWAVFAVASSRIVERMAEKNCAFDHVDHRATFKAMKLQGVSLFSMALIAAIWNGSCLKERLERSRRAKFGRAEGFLKGRWSLQSSS